MDDSPKDPKISGLPRLPTSLSGGDIMKNVILGLLAVPAFSLLVLATKTFGGGPPDSLYQTCVDPSDRTMIRTLRNMCDDDATGQGYNVGIFRPYNENVDHGRPIKCSGLDDIIFVCLGAPHKEEELCPDGSLPPCEAE